MKKLISLLLALTMVFSLAICASAAEIVDNKVQLEKTYRLIGTGSNPQETFTVENIVAYKVTDAADGVTEANMPMIEVGEVTFEKDAINTESRTATGKIDITIPGVTADPTEEKIAEGKDRYDVYPSVGKYYYKFNEVDAGVEGVDYYATEMHIVVTVTKDERTGLLRVAAVHAEGAPEYNEDGTLKDSSKKTDKFENTYTAGTLLVEKYISGDFGDTTDVFSFKVEFVGTNVNSEVTYIVNGDEANAKTLNFTDDKLTHEFTLKHDERIKFINLPEGVTYTVTETDDLDYTKTEIVASDADDTIEGVVATGTISAIETEGVKTGCDDDTVVYTNTKDGNVDTGISLDSMPFVLILAVCAGAAVLFITKRRSVEF